MRFRATLQRDGKTATGIRVPAEVMSSFGQSKRLAVRATINSYTYRSTVVVMGGEFKLPVSAEVRERAGIAANDEVDVDLEPDTEPREVAVPPDLADALGADADARRVFDGLSVSNRKRMVLSVETAKTAETRQKRITKAVSMLREGNL